MPLSLDEIRAIAAAAVAPRHFFVGNGLELEWEHTPAEDIPWEIYKGRLLDASQTRERRTFEAWNIYSIDEFGRSTEPLLSLKLDAETGELHVVRAILCYAWEAYDAGDNVILSREMTKWVRELVGTTRPPVSYYGRELNRSEVRQFFQFDLIRSLLSAVVGTSRLPLTSVEAPLPPFSLGRLAYFYQRERKTAGPMRSWHDLEERIGSAVPHSRERLLEFFLRAVPSEDLTDATIAWMERFTSHEHDTTVRMRSEATFISQEGARHLDALTANPTRAAADMLRRELGALFNGVALTPFTDFVDKVLAFVECLQERGRLEETDVAHFLGALLLKLCRHLTAYDLVTFHHRGANYPDALLLDSALKAFLRLIERFPGLFQPSAQDDEKAENRKRILRRALRQGWLLRRRYEGHLVPDEPTSPGENLRVLPPPHVRVPDAQILNPAERTKRLYDGDPLDRYLGEQARLVLLQSLVDLRQADELREFGMATFLDRPFGMGKQPTEPDGTILLSYQAFSRSIARQRLDLLATVGMLPDQTEQERLQRMLDSLEVAGIAVRDLARRERTSVVSLADALRVADDFVLLRTTWGTWHQFVRQYLWARTVNPTQSKGTGVRKEFSLRDYWAKPLQAFRLRFLSPSQQTLVLCDTDTGTDRPRITIYDSRFRRRMELDYDPYIGYRKDWWGIEYPASPVRVLRMWEDGDDDQSLVERDFSADPILLA